MSVSVAVHFNVAAYQMGCHRFASAVFGSAMAIFFLGERLQLFHLFGYGLVLIGVFVAARKPKTG